MKIYKIGLFFIVALVVMPMVTHAWLWGVSDLCVYGRNLQRAAREITSCAIKGFIGLS